MKQISLLVILFSVSFLFLQCKSEVAGPDEGSTPIDTAKTYLYDPDIKKILNSNCISCHGASFPSGGLSLTSYNAVSAVSGKIKDRVNRTDGLMMPQGGPQLSVSDRKIIDAWIATGKKEK
ncbi:MAG: cytochrome c [Bacteroidetes bacterium]|nr:cytochrome c [Bacteroidota bacterium]